MKETPMIFNGEMVRAILEGRKTHTRRLDGLNEANLRKNDWTCPERCNTDGRWVFTAEQGPAQQLRLKCRWNVGDLIWVRETWMPFDTSVDSVQIGYKASNDIRPNGVSVEDFGSAKWLSAPPDVVNELYKDIEHMNVYGDRWRPSIHMPRWACRIVLEIVAIRVERLCEISHEDAISEGCQGNGWKVSENCKNGIDILYPCMQFKELWNSIYKNWDENPWVWVIEFRRVE